MREDNTVDWDRLMCSDWHATDKDVEFARATAKTSPMFMALIHLIWASAITAIIVVPMIY